MTYSPVSRAHIVPRHYLRRFALNDRVTLRLSDRVVESVPTSAAAVRKRFYRRHRPDGTPIDDVEYTLSTVEDNVAPLLAQVEQRWPLQRNEKFRLAEFFALQMVRTPAWRKWYSAFVRQASEARRSDRQIATRSGLVLPLSDGMIGEAERWMLSSTQWLRRMLGAASLLITALGSMRWHLIEFREPALGISDQPVIQWPLNQLVRDPAEPAPNGYGISNLLEIQIPLSSKSALLATWIDDQDDPTSCVGDGTMAAGINAAGFAQSERQWMHRPDLSPHLSKRPIPPLSAYVLPGYDARHAERSLVRAKVKRIVAPLMGEDPRDSVEIVWPARAA